jgi:DNA-binding response OmpR family regulator
MLTKPKVLIADDEPVIADTLAKILDNSGFEATVVYTGKRAVETANTLRPDVFISDVIMPRLNGLPGLNGVKAAIEIRKNLPACKILLLSGENATADLLEEARNRGYDFEVLAKPIPPSELLARLDKLIKRSEEHGLAS